MTLPKNEKALVLCGGGGKGAFQIGAWKALSKSGILDNVTAISGTSVGALNSALFALGDSEKAINIWRRIRPNTLLPIVDFIYMLIDVGDNPDEAIPKIIENGIFSRIGLEKIMDSLDLKRISESKKKIFVGVSNINSMFKIEYIELNGKSPAEIKKYLLASSAIPLIYPQEKIGRKRFVDGGFLHDSGKIPILPVYNAGYRNIIIIALETDFALSNMKDFFVGRIDAGNFRDCNFTVIKPIRKLGGTLDFSHSRIMENMAQGYFSAMCAMGLLEKKYLIYNDMEMKLP